MLRIIADESSGRRVLRIEGRLHAGNIAELEQAWAAEANSVSVDLSNLDHADEGGLELLLSLVHEGAELLNASPFIRMLLEQQDDR